jgi:hypothetical protein
VELRLTVPRLRPGRRRHFYAVVAVRLLVFWIAPALLVLGLAYVFAGHS